MINENFARQAIVSKNISDKTSRAEGHMQPSKLEEKNGKVFGYVQCDNQVSKKLERRFC